MKNNRGFTFVELIAVLVIIVILFVVSLPPIMRIFKSTQLKVDEGIQKIIEDGTKDLLVNETAAYDNKDTNKYCIKILKYRWVNRVRDLSPPLLIGC